MTLSSLAPALRKLPENASEAVIKELFLAPLLQMLGFNFDEVVPEFYTGRGNVDKAARKNVNDDIFLITKANPYLIVECKSKEIILTSDSIPYRNAVSQLKGYLLDKNCQTVQWGIVTNSSSIQLFRKHGKAIFPATKLLPINEGNVDNVVSAIARKIEKPLRAISVAVYNNKGGVGKTTTTANLAGILSLNGKKVLAIDFDHNQRDLTTSLGLNVSQGKVYEALTNRDISLKTVIKKYVYRVPKTDKKIGFDVIPADDRITTVSESELTAYLQVNSLYKKLEELKHIYDYIIIDAPPNWRLLSHIPVYAADVVLIPTKHNGLFSLENAAIAIAKFIPETYNKKADGTPIALPIFFNGEDISDAQLLVARETIDRIIKTYQKQHKFNLSPYFYPKYRQVSQNKSVAQVPRFAHIANCAFYRIPAVYGYKIARDYYTDLVKEYFIQ